MTRDAFALHTLFGGVSPLQALTQKNEMDELHDAICELERRVDSLLEENRKLARENTELRMIVNG